MAQWIARPTSNRKVAGSSPAVGVLVFYTKQSSVSSVG